MNENLFKPLLIDWLLAKRMSCSSIDLNSSLTSAGMEKILQKVSYVQFHTYARFTEIVEQRSKPNFFIASSNNVSQGVFAPIQIKKVVEISHFKPYKFSCDGGTIQNFCTSSLNFRMHEFSQHVEELFEAPIRWQET